MHKEWCENCCSECKTRCVLDESIPCSPDCDLLNEDGIPINLYECLESGCDAIICIDKIQDGIAAELEAYKKRMTSMNSVEVYGKSYDIHLVEEIAFFICDRPEDYKDDTDIIWVLYRLSSEKQFLDEYLKWSGTLDSLDLSNVEKAYETLKDFCDCQSEEPV